MAKATEGIALLSMYGDDEEEDEATAPTMVEEAAVATKEEEAADESPTEDEGHEFDDENLNDNYNRNDYQPKPFDAFSYSSPQPLTSPSPLRFLDDSQFKALISPFPQRTPTPQRAVTPQRALTPQPPASRSLLSSPSILTSPSPSTLAAPHFIQKHSDEQRTRRISMAIVDYAHDEAAMSPDSEVMEIENNGRVVFGVEIHVSNGNIEGTTPVSSQLLTPSSEQEPVLSLDARDQSKYEASIAMEFCGTESEVFEVKASPTSINMQIDEPLQSFLPPTVTTKCSEELQEKINKFLTYKKAGKSFNADLRNRKDYRNPNFLQHAVSYQDIDEIGTCFSKEVFDPHGYDQSDYYDEIEADMKRELERKEQERKKSQKIDFISGTAQPVGVAPAAKMNAPSPASSVSTLLNSSLPPNSSTSDASRDCRMNKKSKWDKVDGDTKIPSGGHDNPPNVSVHAAHLTAANAGTGYSAFAQLKRREAEERKSGERKFDKRS